VFRFLVYLSNLLVLPAGFLFGQVDYSYTRSSFPVFHGTSSLGLLQWTSSAADAAWTCQLNGQSKFSLPPAVTSYQVPNFQNGLSYEFSFKKSPVPGDNYRNVAGHLVCGTELPISESPGGVLLLCEQTLAENAGPELRDYLRELEAEGWRAYLRALPASRTPKLVRDDIAEIVAADPSISHILILGHVAVPYSGGRGFYPDAHKQHEGAWPCDGYYADAKSDNSSWPDVSAFTPAVDGLAKGNLPQDGVWDCISFPSTLEYCVGRVDFANLPAFALTGFSSLENELHLMRRYFTKATAFRRGQVNAKRRVTLQDTMATVEDGPGRGVYRGYGPAFGQQACQPGTWLTSNTASLAGEVSSPGLLVNGRFSACQLFTAQQVAAGRVNSVFNHCFGSYFGDWDNTDNLLRAVIASPGLGLTALWDGRPAYSMHHMAVGKTVGYSVRFSMNVTFSDSYDPGLGSRGVHMALMGDPTLTLLPLPQPRELTAELRGTVTVPSAQLSWLAPTLAVGEVAISGYHVYRSISPGEPYVRLTSVPLASTTLAYTDAAVTPCSRYQVKALRLEATTSGSFWNQSAAATAVVQAGAIHPVDLWKRQHFGAAAGGIADQADYDRDGILNLLEFALGTNPRVAESSPLKMLANTSGQLSVSYTEPTWSCLPVIFEQSADLTRWTARTPSGATFAKPGWVGRCHCVPLSGPKAAKKLYCRLRALR
jgi:hypothetical protein